MIGAAVATGLVGGTTSDKLGDEFVLGSAERGPFVVTVSEKGTLESRSNVTLVCQVSLPTTIISLVAEGTRVDEGDVVCELDTAVLNEDEADDRMDLTEAKAAAVQAEKELEITVIENESLVAKAKVEWELAELDLESYTHEEGEYRQLAAEAGGKLELAREDLKRAEENLAFTERMARRGYRTQNEVEADRLAVRKAELEVDTALKSLKVLTDFTRKRTVAEYAANAKDLKLEYERAKLKAEMAEQKAKAELEKQKLLVEVRQIEYDEVLQELALCKIVAPQSGTVIYATDRRRSYDEDSQIREGTQVRRRQAIIKIPDLTQMKVETRIHESRIRLISVGQSCDVRVDAIPDEIFQGTVSKVASVPASHGWRDGDSKYYDVEVTLAETDEGLQEQLRPGLSAEVEVLVESRDDVLQVPVQAIVAVGGVGHIFVRDGARVSRRVVVTGKTNDRFTEILDGLDAGDEVVLNPRTRFADEIAGLDAESEAAEDAAAASGDRDTADALPAAA
ncbi:MAG: efflux RND transporter periplasmic adaptor subunit [Planctomycetota bacterium]